MPSVHFRGILFFFFNDTATTEIYTLSLHDALPVLKWVPSKADLRPVVRVGLPDTVAETGCISKLIQNQGTAGARSEPRRYDLRRELGARNRGEIAIRATGFAVVPQAVRQGEVRLDL